MDSSTLQAPAQISCAHCQRSLQPRIRSIRNPKSVSPEGADNYTAVFVSVNTRNPKLLAATSAANESADGQGARTIATPPAAVKPLYAGVVEIRFRLRH